MGSRTSLRAYSVALIPALLICVGMAATVAATALENAAYRGMGCTWTAPLPIPEAVLSSLAVAAGVAAFTIALWPLDRTLRDGRFRDVHATFRTLTTIVAAAGTVVGGWLRGPRDQHGIDPAAGLTWAIYLVVALITAATIRGALEVWWARGSRDPVLWIVLGIGLVASAVCLAGLGDSFWLDPHTLRKVCWYGIAHP